MPDIDNTIWQPYADDGVLVYGVYGNEDVGQLQDFIEQTGVTYPILRDEGSRAQLSFPQGVGYPYPRDLVIGKDGTIRSIRNSFNAEEMEQLVLELLAE